MAHPLVAPLPPDTELAESVEAERGPIEGPAILVALVLLAALVIGVLGIGVVARGAVGATPVPGVETAISQAGR